MNGFSEIHLWASKILAVNGPGVGRIIFSEEHKEVFFRILLNRLEFYLDKLIFGDIDIIYLCCYRSGKGEFTFYFSGTIKGTKVFDYNLGDIWENKDFLRLYLGDLVLEILDGYRPV